MRIILIVLLLQLCSQSVLGAIITGAVYDRESGEPIPYVTIRVEGTGRSALANEQGQYRLLLEPGVYSLRFSHVAHFSDYLEVEVGDSSLVLDVILRPAIVELPGIRVYDRAYDPAQRIIVEAIRHKQEILARLRSYRCQAYVKSVIRAEDKDDSVNILGIVESQLEYLWEQPDKYKETIVARRQTSNIKADLNVTSIENIPDFNRDRVKFDRYSIISPTATDALKYYNYYLLDTIFVDGKTVFRLEVEPKNETDPLVVGTIDIADSTFNIVGVEGGLGAGVYLPYVKNFHYNQRFAELGDGFWMPIEIHVEMTVSYFGKRFSIDYVFALSDYTFDYAMPVGTFDYALEITKDADDVDSVTWNARQMIPLTSEEQRGYERIDSLVNAPKPLYKRALSGLWFLYRSTFNYDLFRFNRVEGAYVGIGQHWWEPLPSMELEIRTG
ncbi:MAG: carboxypeptidase-like regulatory domain-containing protein, partial [candidate division Zixibacteria bacterium]|nr:carboxypeptidase-like regulatory domain-containing protein [candidate division Zixibacteria bacterium]